MKLTKYGDKPIFSPNPLNKWEALSVCNPGCWYENGKFSLLYRAAGEDPEHRIYLGLAESADGFNFTRVSDTPVLAPLEDNFDGGCVEDPRIVKFDGEFYVTYAYRPFPPGQYWAEDKVALPLVSRDAPSVLKKNLGNSGLLRSTDLRHFQRLGRLTRSKDDDRDVIIFPEKIKGQYAMLHRPVGWVGPRFGCDCPSIWISFSDDLLEWEGGTLLVSGDTQNDAKIGGSTPPLKTAQGWIMLYHAVDVVGTYRVGAYLLDLDDPTKILAKTKNYILEPEYEWERKGLYSKGGGCVFPTGNVIVGDTIYVYYGAADKYIGVATCKVSDLLNYLLN